MVFPVAGAGTTPPIYPTGSTGNGLKAAGFIPEIWSGKLIEKFYAATVLAAISNTDYEGEIKNLGDTVKIRTKPTITIKDYRADGLLELERPKGSLVELNIDKAKYFNTILDDVMEVQSDLNNMSLWADDASEQMKIVIDTQVLTDLYGEAHPDNMGTAAGKVSGDINLGESGAPLVIVSDEAGAGEVDVIDLILRLGQVLDEQNIPEQGRWLIIPTWVSTMIKRSELRQAYLSGDGVSMLRNGRLGMIDRFTVYVSNLLPNGVPAGVLAGEFVIYAGHAHALTFASQINNVESMRSEMTFGTILRGLQVYGYEVIDNVALAEAVITKA
jgi:hypothetical protein